MNLQRIRRVAVPTGIALWAMALCWLYVAQRTAPPVLVAVLHGVINLLTGVFFALIFSALGRPLVRWIFREHRNAISELETALCGFGLGAATISLTVFLLGTLGLLHGELLLVVALIGSAFAVFSDFSDAVREARGILPASTLLLVAPFLGLALACAFAEPASTDAVLYHLSLPAVYLRQHSMTPVPNNIFCFFPMAGEMLYTVGLSIAGETAPAIITLCFAIANLLLLQRMWEGAGVVTPAIVFFSMPSAAINAGYPYVDHALIFYVVSAFWALGRFFETRHRAFLIVSGLLCSAAIATKYTGFCALASFLVLFLIRRFPGGARALLVFLALTTLFAGPWLLRNTAYTGNPLYPLFSSVLGSSETYRPERQTYALRHIQGGLGDGWQNILGLPYYHFFKQPFLDDTIGPSIAILLPLMLLVVRRRRDIFVLSGLFAVMVVAISPQAKYMLPVFALLSVAGCEGLSKVRSRCGAGSVSLAILVTATINLMHVLFYYRVTFDPVPRLLGMESREQYLTRTRQDYPAIAFLNAMVPPGAAVLTVGQLDFFHIQCKGFPESQYDTPLAVSLVHGCRTPQDLARRLSAAGFTHVLYNAYEIRRMSWIPGEYLDWKSPGDKQVFFGFLAQNCRQLFSRDDVTVYSILPVQSHREASE